jgi:uncharacterized membrane protein
MSRHDDRDLLAQLYRGQMARADTWRQRLDTTTNWAVMLTAALLTWIFSSPSHPHYVLLVGMVAATLFLFIEARRYRQYDVWRYRVRMIEEHMFSAELRDEGERDRGWRDTLADDLRQATTKIPYFEALVRRLRRVHAAIFAVLLLAWLFKVIVFPAADKTPLEAMSIGGIPGTLVGALVAAYTLTVITLSVLPIRRRAKGEIADDGDFDHKHD